MFCRLCTEEVESTTHFVCSCSQLEGNQCRKNHGRVGKKTHWLLCNRMWTEVVPRHSEPVLKN